MRGDGRGAESRLRTCHSRRRCLARQLGAEEILKVCARGKLVPKSRISAANPFGAGLPGRAGRLFKTGVKRPLTQDCSGAAAAIETCTKAERVAERFTSRRGSLAGTEIASKLPSRYRRSSTSAATLTVQEQQNLGAGSCIK